MTEAATRNELLDLLSHALSNAGNATLMTAQLKDTLVDHSAGNYRVLMSLAGELLAYGMVNDIKQLDEKAYLEVFQPSQPPPPVAEEGEGVKLPVTVSPLLPVVRVVNPDGTGRPALACGGVVGRNSVGVIGGAAQVLQDMAGTGYRLECGHGHGTGQRT